MITLITGCRSGFGLLSAVSAARAGHTVYAGLRDPETADDLMAAADGLPVHPLALDVTEPEQCQAAVDRVLSEHGWKIAPRTFYAWRKRPPSQRALWEMTITEVLAGYYQPDGNGRRRPESLYGSLKMWAHLNR